MNIKILKLPKFGREHHEFDTFPLRGKSGLHHTDRTVHREDGTFVKQH